MLNSEVILQNKRRCQNNLLFSIIISIIIFIVSMTVLSLVSFNYSIQKSEFNDNCLFVESLPNNLITFGNVIKILQFVQEIRISGDIKIDEFELLNFYNKRILSCCLNEIVNVTISSSVLKAKNVIFIVNEIFPLNESCMITNITDSYYIGNNIIDCESQNYDEFITEINFREKIISLKNTFLASCPVYDYFNNVLTSLSVSSSFFTAYNFIVNIKSIFEL